MNGEKESEPTSERDVEIFRRVQEWMRIHRALDPI